MLPMSEKERYNPENLAQYRQIVSNCCLKFSAKCAYSNSQNHAFFRKLTFGKVAKFTSKVKRSWWAKIMLLTKNAVNQSVIGTIT